MAGYQLINKPASLGIKTLAPGPRSLPSNAGQARTHILFKLKACSKTLEVCGRISYYFYYVNFGIVRCYGYDKTVFYAYYFIYSVYCFFGSKDNEVIFGCIGLTDTVVCSNLSYSLFRALSV